MKDIRQYIGREVVGVRFESREYRDLVFVPDMEGLVGCAGVITEYIESDNSFRVDFGSPIEDYWFYPVEVIIPQLEE